jgi:hypothetical protein
LKFQFGLDSVPATGRNFSGILNLGEPHDLKNRRGPRRRDPKNGHRRQQGADNAGGRDKDQRGPKILDGVINNQGVLEDENRTTREPIWKTGEWK